MQLHSFTKLALFLSLILAPQARASDDTMQVEDLVVLASKYVTNPINVPFQFVDARIYQWPFYFQLCAKNPNEADQLLNKFLKHERYTSWTQNTIEETDRYYDYVMSPEPNSYYFHVLVHKCEYYEPAQTPEGIYGDWHGMVGKIGKVNISQSTDARSGALRAIAYLESRNFGGSPHQELLFDIASTESADTVTVDFRFRLKGYYDEKPVFAVIKAQYRFNTSDHSVFVTKELEKFEDRTNDQHW